MNKLSVVVSGRKQSGKNSTCNYILARYLNLMSSGTRQEDEEFRYSVDAKGNLHLTNIRADTVERYSENSFRTELKDYSKTFEILAPDQFSSPSGQGARIYSFADPLKQFCINVFGATVEQMYGTDAQKNSIIHHLQWENLPLFMRWLAGGKMVFVRRHPFLKFEKPELFPVEKAVTPESIYALIKDPDELYLALAQSDILVPSGLRTGTMTGRDLMQIFGTEMVRRLYSDAWARATYSAIQSDGQELALICDGRFPNEIEMGTSVKAKSIRLLRAVYTEDAHASETALDNYPSDKYTVVVDNRDMTLEEQLKFLDPYIDEWFNEAGIRR